MRVAAGSNLMAPRRILITAGNTREPIDRVRDWGNIFTGNTGYAIARAMTALGDVDLLTSNRNHVAQAAQDQIRASPFTSHAELKGALAALLARQKYDAIFMTAAVADYTPAGVYQILHRTPTATGEETWTVRNVQAEKVESNHGQIAILGQPTEKIIDLFRTPWNHAGLLFKFKLEVGIPPEELLRIGRESRAASRADYLIANTLDMIEGENAGAYLISQTGHEFIPRPQLAQKLVELVRTHRQ
jgi:phosphopantothenoylcysteine decarboxylase/phosphopantothenate--cysteine ligase